MAASGEEPQPTHNDDIAVDRYNESDDDDDEVVAEFDICLAGSLKDQIQLL